MPVEQLLGEDEQPLALTRSCSLYCDDIRALLRGGGVRFVVANVGHPFAWAEGPEVFKVWKTEVQPHLAPPMPSSVLRTSRASMCISHRCGSHQTGRTRRRSSCWKCITESHRRAWPTLAYCLMNRLGPTKR